MENGQAVSPQIETLRRDVFQAKGYPCAYAEYLGGHDHPCWEITLPEGQLALAGEGAGAAAGR